MRPDNLVSRRPPRAPRTRLPSSGNSSGLPPSHAGPVVPDQAYRFVRRVVDDAVGASLSEVAPLSSRPGHRRSQRRTRQNQRGGRRELRQQQSRPASTHGRAVVTGNLVVSGALRQYTAGGASQIEDSGKASTDWEQDRPWPNAPFSARMIARQQLGWIYETGGHPRSGRKTLSHLSTTSASRS